MGWFRRRASGKHALGAAVTSIPSGPVTLAVRVPAAAPPSAPVAAPPPPVVADSAAVSAVEPDLMTSIAELLATGEAWAEPASRPASTSAQLAVAVEPRPAPPAIAVEAPVAARVQLGFRDGTSTTLEPGSSQALALEQLAQSLSRRE